MERYFVKSKVEVAQQHHHGESREIKEHCVFIYVCLGQIQEASLILHYLAGKPFAILLNHVPVAPDLGKAHVLRKLSGDKMLIWIYKFLRVFSFLEKILPDALFQLQHLPTWISLIPNINSN